MNSFENQILYDMCENNIKHDNERIVKGKMLLIGRTYAASPERRQGGKTELEKTADKASKKNDTEEIKKAKKKAKEKVKDLRKGTDTDFFDEVSAIIVKNKNAGAELDKEIENLENKSYSYDDKNFDSDKEILEKTVKLIEFFNDMVKYASDQYNKAKYKEAKCPLEESERKAQNMISFASKYLHFHLKQVIFINDKYSVENGKRECSKEEKITIFKEEFKEPYKDCAEHAMRCYLIAKKLKEKGQPCSPRDVDNILMKRELTT